MLIFSGIWSLLKRGYNLLANRPVKPSDDDRAVGEGIRPGPVVPEEAPISPLFYRLDKAASDSERDVRRLQLEDIVGTRLSDELLGLMFDQQYKRGDFTTNWIIDALQRQRTLDLRRRVFYIYVDEEVAFRSGSQLLKDLYARIIELSRKVSPLYDFINEVFTSKLAVFNPDAKFNWDDPEHSGAVPYFLPCLINVHPKKFPDDGRAKVFIVGRAPLHDVLSIERREQELLQVNAKGRIWNPSDAQKEPIVKVAAEVAANGNQDGKRVLFNAHFFQPNDTRSRPEQMLYIGDWPTDCEISIGSAEHDEIRCAALGGASGKAALHNICFINNQWDFELKAPRLVPWLDIKKTWKFDPKAVGVQVRVKPSGSAAQRLFDLIRKTGFIPEVRLAARVLPFQMEKDFIKRTVDSTPRDFRTVLGNQQLVSIIEVHKDLWLMRSEAGSVIRLERRGGQWTKSGVTNSEDFLVGDYRYTWRVGVGDDLPPQFCGILYIEPPDADKPQYIWKLAVDLEADEVPLAYGRPFTADINPDTMLGGGGVVSLKCVEPVAGKPTYALLPVPNALNEFFAFSPAIRPANSAGRWLTYEGREGAAAAGPLPEPMLAVGANNNLICGTSFFYIKTSVTPQISESAAGHVASVRALPAAPEAPSQEAENASAPAGVGAYNPLQAADVKARLMGTKWGIYDINESGQSNVAAHYVLANGAGNRRFLKAFYAGSTFNAEREEKFYKRYRDRAPELFLRPPEDVLYDAGYKPWALVFERLRPFERAPNLAQIAAIGYAVATLLRAMDADGQINFDIHSSMICLDGDGRIVVVDFDNVFPVLSAAPTAEELAAVRDILMSGKLPTSGITQPPEARLFQNQSGPVERQPALSQIGTPYCVYMLAVMMIEMGKLGESSLTDDGWQNVRVRVEETAERGVAEGLPAAAAQGFALLLEKMLHPVGAHRPKPDEVLGELRTVIAAYAGASKQVEEEIYKLLGGTPG